MLKKSLFLLLGAILTLIGALFFISPLPIGFVFLIPGLALLIMGNESIANWVQARRKKHQTLDNKLDTAQEIAPDEICDPLKRTDPKDIS